MSEGRYRHPTFEERGQIAGWRLEGVSQAAMARLGRSSSTINREVARNQLPSGGYMPSFAVCAANGAILPVLWRDPHKPLLEMKSLSSRP